MYRKNFGTVQLVIAWKKQAAIWTIFGEKTIKMNSTDTGHHHDTVIPEKCLPLLLPEVARGLRLCGALSASRDDLGKGMILPADFHDSIILSFGEVRPQRGGGARNDAFRTRSIACKWVLITAVRRTWVDLVIRIVHVTRPSTFHFRLMLALPRGSFYERLAGRLLSPTPPRRMFRFHGGRPRQQIAVTFSLRTNRCQPNAVVPVGRLLYR